MKAEPKPDLKKGKTKKYSNMIEDDGDSSDWSLASLEELKTLNIKETPNEDDPSEHNKEKKAMEVKFPPKPVLLCKPPLH